jgi:DNA polymerase
VKELLAIRLQASTTSTSKYKSLMKGVSSDGRLRGTLQFCGASRTGRWAGRLFQPQNLPRPSLEQEQIDEGIEALKAGCADLLFDNIMELTSSALRGCIMAPEGKKLVVSDLSNIEGRKLAWLAGEAWKLDAFRDYDGDHRRGDAAEQTPRPLQTGLCRLQHLAGGCDQIPASDRQGDGAGPRLWRWRCGVPDLRPGLRSRPRRAGERRAAEHSRDVIREAKSWYDESVKRKATYGLSERVFIACDSLKRLWRRAHPEPAISGTSSSAPSALPLPPKKRCTAAI